MMSKKPTIFVNIAAYRDAEAYPTIMDLFEKAKHPENIHVGICWQYNSLREEPFLISDRKHQVSVINLDYKKAKGACWARHVVQKLYNNETYYLQVDAHSRFIPNWDTAMIEELDRCDSDRPILSTYPNHYTLPNVITDHGPYKLIFNTFHHKVPTFHSRSCTEEERLNPSLSPIVSGGFLFSRAAAMLDVPYDPYIYFIGEEITMSARYWTHGYDIFTPTKSMVFHLYVVPELTKTHHWSDHPDWHDNYEIHSRQRVLHLLDAEETTNAMALRDLECYDLGPYGHETTRSLAQYEAFAGIDFKTQTLSESAKLGIPSA
jgi:hypothetical protein